MQLAHPGEQPARFPARRPDPAEAPATPAAARRTGRYRALSVACRRSRSSSRPTRSRSAIRYAQQTENATRATTSAASIGAATVGAPGRSRTLTPIKSA